MVRLKRSAVFIGVGALLLGSCSGQNVARDNSICPPGKIRAAKQLGGADSLAEVQDFERYVKSILEATIRIDPNYEASRLALIQTGLDCTIKVARPTKMDRGVQQYGLETVTHVVSNGAHTLTCLTFLPPDCNSSSVRTPSDHSFSRHRLVAAVFIRPNTNLVSHFNVFIEDPF